MIKPRTVEMALIGEKRNAYNIFVGKPVVLYGCETWSLTLRGGT
jgi:hypothetical protein